MKNLTKEKIIEYYNNSQSQNEKAKEIISQKPNELISRVSMLMSYHFSFFLKYFYLKSNIQKSKQALYTSGKINIFLNKHSKSYPNQINSLAFILVSDSKELLTEFKNIDYTKVKGYSNKLQYGQTIGFVIQEILKDNIKEALKLLQIFEDKHKKYPLKEQDIAILRAIINKDKQKIEELLEFFLLPKNYKKCIEGSFYDELLSFHILSLAKLAWIKGIEVEVNHPLLPQELLPIKPNKEYFIEYDFLKPDYVPVLKPTKKEVPKPNAKYRKDKPKNKIGITRELIKKIILKNWDAIYTPKELQTNVDLIYFAFINPQEFDKKHYDFLKLGNMHISHSNSQYIFIEEKPCTNMWTSLKKETDYFFDVVGVFFSILGIKQPSDEQWVELRLKLKDNETNSKGFFGRLIN